MNILALILITSSGVNSLLMPVSPAGVLTGFTVARQSEAIFYNPANFAAGENFRLNCFYNRYYLGMQGLSFALSRKFRNLDLGVGITNFDYGPIEWRPDYPSDDTVIYYSAYDFVFMVCGGFPISPQARLGVTAKYVAENIYLYSDYALAFDLSLAYKTDRSGLTFGVTNMGSQIKLNGEEVNLPARLSLGLSRDFSKFNAAIEAHYLVNRVNFEFGFSAGVPLYKILELSAGLHYRYEDPVFPAFGLDLDLGKFAIKYGLALYPYNLGPVSTLGFGLEF
jgi:hypothetical protein